MHIPRRVNKKHNVGKQLLYWREKLGIQIEQEVGELGWLKEVERGAVEISVDLGMAGLNRYRSPSNLVGVRLLLVIYACHYNV